MAYGLSLDLLFFDDENSEASYSTLDNVEEFERGDADLYRSRLDGTTAVKSAFSKMMMANVYSFHIPGDAAAIELVQRLVTSEREALLGRTPLDSTGPNTILLVTDAADHAARVSDGQRAFVVVDGKLQDPEGFVAALRVIEQGQSVEDEIEAGMPEVIASAPVVIPALVISAYAPLTVQAPVAQDRRFFVGSPKSDSEALTQGVFAALGVNTYAVDAEEDGGFYAYADSNERSVSVASVLSLPRMPWMEGMQNLVEVMISTEVGLPTTDETAREKWAMTFGMAVTEESAEGAAMLQLQGLRQSDSGLLETVNVTIDPNAVWGD